MIQNRMGLVGLAAYAPGRAMVVKIENKIFYGKLSSTP